MINRRTYTWLSLILLLLSAAWIAASVPPPGASIAGSSAAPRTGLPAPDFELETLDGSMARLSDFRGQAVIVNVWTSWCPPCKKEMPAFQRVYQAYEAQGLVILAVNALSQDELEDVQRFSNDYGLTFRIPLDPNAEVLQAYQVRAFPTSFFIDREGIIRNVIIGGVSEPLLRAQVQDLLEREK